VLLEFLFLHLRANSGINLMLEAYFDMLSLYLVKVMLENLSMSVEIRILKALQFSCGKFRPCSNGFFSCDLPAWRYRNTQACNILLLFRSWLFARRHKYMEIWTHAMHFKSGGGWLERTEPNLIHFIWRRWANSHFDKYFSIARNINVGIT